MNVLEEYLVKIGADIDRNAFAGASQAINQLAGTLNKLNFLLKYGGLVAAISKVTACLLYTSPSPRDRTRSRMPSSA